MFLGALEERQVSNGGFLGVLGAWARVFGSLVGAQGRPWGVLKAPWGVLGGSIRVPLCVLELQCGSWEAPCHG